MKKFSPVKAELRRAQLASDVAALDRLLDDVFVFASFDGTLASKGHDLSLHHSGRCESRASGKNGQRDGGSLPVI
jgi:hypothetical protein